MSDFAVTRIDEPIKDNYTWAASSHGFHTARNATLNLSAFTKATHFPNGYVPSGTPVRLVGDEWEPLVATTNVEYDGIVLEPVAVRDGQAKALAAVLDEGIVHGARLRGSVAGAKPNAAIGIVQR